MALYLHKDPKCGKTWASDYPPAKCPHCGVTENIYEVSQQEAAQKFYDQSVERWLDKQERIDMEHKWSKEWPTEIGFFWFFGFCHNEMHVNPPRLHFVKTDRIKGELVYVTDEPLMFRGQSDGLWMPVALPTLPTQEEFPWQPTEED